MSGIYDQVVSLSNARYSGGGLEGARYLFSGFKTDTPAFTDAGLYQGDDGEYKVQVGAGESVTVGLSGARVFQGDVDIFSVLQDLEGSLASGMELCKDGRRKKGWRFVSPAIDQLWDEWHKLDSCSKKRSRQDGR